MAYSKEIKAVAIKMMLPPNSKMLTKKYEYTNTHLATLAKWREEVIKDGTHCPCLRLNPFMAYRRKTTILQQQGNIVNKKWVQQLGRNSWEITKL